MKRFPFVIALTLLTAVLLTACGSSDSAPVIEKEVIVEVVKEVVKTVEVPGQRIVVGKEVAVQGLMEEQVGASADRGFSAARGAPAVAPGPMSTPASTFAPPSAPATAAMSAERAMDVTRESEVSSDDIQLVSQRRIIVRTVDMSLVVVDVAASLDAISDLAKRFDGWVVSSDRSRTHSGFISIRVPSDDLDTAILELRAMAKEVEREVTTSKDVTDEYVDLNSRLTNQQATEGALLKLLERAENVEAALEVQRELSRVQEEIERILGRIKFLEETSAFSLVSIRLELAPIEMPVDAGEDQTVSVPHPQFRSEFEPARFRATFEPPEGIEHFVFTWDFGDGSPPVTSDRTAPTAEEGKRVTATMTHFYSDTKDSPYIVEIEMRGTGDTGVAEGDDTLIVTVTELPTVQVFAGENQIVDEDEEVKFSGSFTRPDELTSVRYKWDFGDGSAPETGNVPKGVTKVDSTHTYTDHRPFPFTATLTITAQSEAGEVETASQLSLIVRERPAWTVAGWEPGDTGRTAVRTLSWMGQGVVSGAIWAGIFSPLWLAAGGALLIWRRIRRRSAAV